MAANKHKSKMQIPGERAEKALRRDWLKLLCRIERRKILYDAPRMTVISGKSFFLFDFRLLSN